MLNTSTKAAAGRYSPLAPLCHWGFAALFIYGVIKQVGDVGQLADTAFLRVEMIFAIVFLILLAGRFTYMKARTVSVLPAATPAWQRRAAKFVH